MVKPNDSKSKRKMAGTNVAHGFSLIELLIVIAIFGVVSSMAVLALQRFIANNHLRTAAHDLAGNIALYRQKAVGHNDNYTISFDMANNSYTIRDKTPSYQDQSDPDPSDDDNQKSPSDFGSGCALSGVNVNPITIQSRGLVSPVTIIMTNSRGSTATIKISSAGRTDTQFAMQ